MRDAPATLSKIWEGLVRSYPKLAVKSALPELARQYMVQAETYFQGKDFAEAIEAYGKLIGVAPWFPPAYFNRAFLEGEQQQYKAAVADMQTYLKLAPNAQDAREAQDQIYAWQAKAK
jgi:tetratricopeptide (TPR) repeat protein